MGTQNGGYLFTERNEWTKRSSLEKTLPKKVLVESKGFEAQFSPSKRMGFEKLENVSVGILLIRSSLPREILARFFYLPSSGFFSSKSASLTFSSFGASPVGFACADSCEALFIISPILDNSVESSVEVFFI